MFWRVDGVAPSSPSSTGKRMHPARLLQHLDRYSSDAMQDFALSPKQCRLLIEAMQSIASWICAWLKISLSAPFVQDLLAIATNGVRLLELCEDIPPSSWLTIAALRLESKEDFLHLFQAFVQALQGYIEVMEPPFLHQNMHVEPPSPSTRRSPHLRCVDEAKCLITSLNDQLHFLEFKAAEDRRAMLERLEQGSFSEGVETQISELLKARLENPGMCVDILLLDMRDIKFQRQIGAGAFGVVFKGTWMGMDVAVKQFSYQASLDAELKALLKTNHVNIIKAIGYVPEVDGNNPCMVMERMEGDLGKFVEKLKSELPLLVAVEILLQLAAGMAHLHEKEIMHRDLKPENILFDIWPPMSMKELHTMTQNFTAKITDFGECRIQTYNTTEATAKRGSLWYRAPEVISDINLSGRACYSNKVDVYSFGMVCYKLLTRKDPRVSTEKAKQGDFSQLTSQMTNIPRAFVFFMGRCWSRDHKHRPSFLEICDFLALFKSILLNTRLIDSRMPPLYLGMRPDLLLKLVAFLGEEWLVEEAASLGIQPQFKESANRLGIDCIRLQMEITKKLAALPGRKLMRLIYCFGGQPSSNYAAH